MENVFRYREKDNIKNRDPMHTPVNMVNPSLRRLSTGRLSAVVFTADRRPVDTSKRRRLGLYTCTPVHMR